MATAWRLLSISLQQNPDHVQTRHLAGLTSYYMAFGEHDHASLDTQHDLTAQSGNFHLHLATILQNGGQAEAALAAFRTAALLNFTLNPAMRAGFGPFNAQILRMQLFAALAASGHLTEVIETGTHWGTTAEYMASRVSCPVLTTEISPYYLEASRLRFADLKAAGCAWADNVQLHALDSRLFLEQVLQRAMPPNGFTFCYLDAHGEYIEGRDVEDPLVGEIRQVRRARSNCIIMIDDFTVPDDAAYYVENGNDMADVAGLLPEFDAVFFPCAARHDSGIRRGCLILSGSSDTTTLLADIGELRIAR